MNLWFGIIIIIICLLVLWKLYYSWNDENNKLPVVEVDLSQYIGKWLEYARLPFPFEMGCTFPTAKYNLNSDGTMGIRNECYYDYETNRKSKFITELIATPVIPPKYYGSTICPGSFVVSAKKNCCFYCGDYNILYINNDYTLAMVATKNRKYLWILVRPDTRIDEDEISKIKTYAKSLGYQINNLIVNNLPDV